MKKRRTTKNFRKKHPIEMNRFYRISDSNGGHPVFVYFCDADKDLYYVQRFSTKPRKDRKKLLHSIDPNSNNEEWLIKKPIAVGYDDLFYNPKYENYRIHPDDMATIKNYQKYNINKKTDELASNKNVSPCDASSGSIIKSK